MKNQNEVMEKRKVDLSSLADETSKGMKSLFDKAKDGIVKVVDQNDDGSFDAEDVAVITDAISDVAKNTAATMKETLEEQRKELERRTLQPFFIEDLDDANFMISKLIRITEIDKKRAESEVCKGSIGYYSDYKDLRIVNIYRENVDLFGLEFYPDAENEIYYVDPTDRGKYIAMEKYFTYLKINRITELKKLAQDLGAKYLRFVYKEKEAKYSSKGFTQQIGIKLGKDKGKAKVDHEVSASEISTMEVLAESEFEGHEPYEPKLQYLKRDLTVRSIIDMRFDEKSPMKSDKFVIELSDTVGIKMEDAVKIDAALKSLKINSNTSVTSEVRNESRKFFEYEIKY